MLKAPTEMLGLFLYKIFHYFFIKCLIFFLFKRYFRIILIYPLCLYLHEDLFFQYSYFLHLP